MSKEDLDVILEKFDAFTQKPVKFLTVQEDVRDDIKNLVKSLYDFTKSGESKKKTNALSELIVEDFDEEQVWQQLELNNTECWDNLVWNVANSMSTKAELVFPIKEPEETIEEPIDNNEDEESNTSFGEREQPIIKKLKNPSQKKPKSSIVDDNFFHLKDMERFLISEEKKDGKQQTVDSDEESIDMFDEIDSEASEEDEENPKDMKYGDFFDDGEDQGDEQCDDRQDNEDEDMHDDREAQSDDNDEKTTKKKKVTFAGIDSEDDADDNEEDDEKDDGEDSDNSETNTNKIMAGARPNMNTNTWEKKSDFEMRQDRLQDTITRLEKKSISDAPWQLKGEVDATKRPQNSLLQEVVDFDLTTRPPPLITEQTTITLEDIIRQRVKDKAWDDVVKKAKPVEDVLAFRKTEVLDHAKSKQSLAEVYEAEYLKQKQAASGTDDTENDKEPEAHTEIRNAMNSLFAKLDALSHYHYTPKAAQPEVKIVSNTPAISMEEVAPVIASSASLLAPEEVKKKTELLSKDERTDTDKKRERRKKKKFQKQKGKVEKVEEHRNTKKGAEASDKALKTSKAFFQHLNDDSTSLIKLNNAKRKNNKK